MKLPLGTFLHSTNKKLYNLKNTSKSCTCMHLYMHVYANAASFDMLTLCFGRDSIDIILAQITRYSLNQGFVR